jgi:hypothetical protein
MFNRPERGKRKGIITAEYQSNLNGLGITSHRGTGFWNWLSKLPGTGDAGLGGRILLSLGLAALVVGIAIVRRKK